MRTIFGLLLIFLSLKADEVINFSTMKASFVQTVTNDQNQSIVYKGTVWLKKPDFALWKYSEPILKDIYINGKKVVIIEPDLFQATSLNSEESINILKVWQKSRPTGSTTRVATINSNKITITHSKDFINTIFYNDELDNHVNIQFLGQAKNIDLIDDFFRAKVPKDYDLIVQ